MFIFLCLTIWLLLGLFSLVFWLLIPQYKYTYVEAKQIIMSTCMGPLTFILLYLIHLEKPNNGG